MGRSDMGDTKDRVGAAGVIVAGGFFKIALFVCILNTLFI